ncbi:ArsR/SmtB family transcription factor [Methylobacterium nodulans]|uniref:Transcriptional regulator, ArsR family n=1 Tax=Methylobacterium nodulans (strain LMG 21967 / CNCM I-2342 / ORS 2060) TaxID=460265 RepID=B8IGF7_METNO|nr:metalloregulator ArsR/SmtB family transcription factor [Methylobacterium nodulans]ACL55857.1 transcriptional regulator, ArsR family [Methylobacterium nodulans ORS 2060]
MSPLESSRQAPADAALLFAALGDTTRLEIVSRLADGRPRSIAQLTEGLALTRQGVAKHLTVLERAGVVASRRVGREHRFAVRPEAIVTARRYLDRVSEQWDDALWRLKSFVEV